MSGEEETQENKMEPEESFGDVVILAVQFLLLLVIVVLIGSLIQQRIKEMKSGEGKSEFVPIHNDRR